MKTPVDVLICGSRGRMGKALLAAAPAAGVRVRAAVDVGDSWEASLPGCDVAIDFSFHTATVALAEAAARMGIPLVIGTTGHDPDEAAAIRAVSAHVPIVWAGNYSIGVNLLFHLTECAAAILGTDYQAEIMEIHHRHKQDAPSGTALDLYHAITRTAGFTGANASNGRSGHTGARAADEIGMHALRGGEVVGEHTVFFFGEKDRIELSHRASDRSIFASGALRAAVWVRMQAPGIYSMRDVLGLQSPPMPSAHSS